MYILVLYILYLRLRPYYFCISQERNSKMFAIKKTLLEKLGFGVRQRKMHIIDILLVYIVLNSSTSCVLKFNEYLIFSLLPVSHTYITHVSS